MKNLNTIRNKSFLVKEFENSVGLRSNTYICLGRPLEWDSDDLNIPQPIETTEYLNNIFRNLVSAKKITTAEMNPVIPRVDWFSGEVYEEYDQNLEIYSYENLQDITGTANANVGENLLIGTNTEFLANVSPGTVIQLNGDGIDSPVIRKEVVEILSNTEIVVNSAFQVQYTSNTVYKVENTYPKFVNKFYVRNSRDQVFKCLFNNNGANSTNMPQIDPGGQLPENAFILTSDGYKWKYMYTIPPGLKEKFFDKDWMPTVDDLLAKRTAVDGRIDIIKIIEGGSGYINSGNSAAANILTVVGDGVGAQLSAKVVNGVIEDISILNPGSGYTKASIVVNDLSKTIGTDDAEFEVIIGPKNGHGFDPAYELGASHLMVSLEFDGDEGNRFPTETDFDRFDFRQISMIRNPLDENGVIASSTRYNLTYKIFTTRPPENLRFYMDEFVYQGLSPESATFSGTVCFWDETNNEIWLNNVNGTFAQTEALRGTVDEAIVTAFNIIPPELKPFSGEVLYIENRSPIRRSVDQAELIKVVISF